LQGALGASLQTLTELHNVQLPVSLPVEGHQRLGLARFGALRSLTLVRTVAPGHGVLARLPLGLRELTLVAGPPGHGYYDHGDEDRAYQYASHAAPHAL